MMARQTLQDEDLLHEGLLNENLLDEEKNRATVEKNIEAGEKNRAVERYREMPAGSVRYGLGIYPTYKEFSFEKFEEELKQSELEFEQELPQDVKIYTLKNLPQQLYTAFFGKLVLPEQGDKLRALHYATLSELRFIHVPANVKCMQPITLATKHKRGSVAVHYIVLAEENSCAIIQERVVSGLGAYALSSVHEFFMKKKAQMTYYHVTNLDLQMYHFNATVVSLEEGSVLETQEFCTGGKFVGHTYRVVHQGIHAHSKYGGAFLTPEQSEYDFFTESTHWGAQTESAIFLRGLVQDRAKVITRSNIHIGPLARSTVSSERADLLLLGEKAQGDAVPMLEVENHDVQCSHGSTVSRLNDEQLFYVQSRGLSRDEAMQILCAAFLMPIIDTFPEEMREELRGKIESYLND